MALIGFQVGAKIVSALLFATGKEGPTDVHVPVTDGARTALYLPWLGTDPDYPLTNATYFDLDMHLDDGTHCAFTVFVADQHNPVGRSDVDHPVNEQVSGHLLHGAIWKGNVLVMRRDSSDGPFSDIRAVDRTHGMSCVVW
jgi:hypothetical protein